MPPFTIEVWRLCAWGYDEMDGRRSKPVPEGRGECDRAPAVELAAVGDALDVLRECVIEALRDGGRGPFMLLERYCLYREVTAVGLCS